MMNKNLQTTAITGSPSETSVTWIGRLATSPTDSDWQKLVNTYAPLLIRWSERAGVASSDRDDLVQDVLIVVLRRVSDFQHRHTGAFRGWLRVIFVNHLKKYFRDQAKNACRFHLDDACDPNSPLSHFFDQEHDMYMAHRAMNVAEKDFSEITWSAFMRQVIEGQSTLQVAQDLQLSTNAVLKAKSRVLKRIRQELHAMAYTPT